MQSGVFLKDGSFLDVWLSDDDDYSFHWEQRAVRGVIHRWDKSSHLPSDIIIAFREVLGFIKFERMLAGGKNLVHMMKSK